MKEEVRAKFRKAWEIYLIPGFVVAAIKMASYVTWLTAQPIASLLGYEIPNSHNTPPMLMFAQGVFSSALAMLLWPVMLFQAVFGTGSLAEWLFFPWVG